MDLDESGLNEPVAGSPTPPAPIVTSQHAAPATVSTEGAHHSTDSPLFVTADSTPDITFFSPATPNPEPARISSSIRSDIPGTTLPTFGTTIDSITVPLSSASAVGVRIADMIIETSSSPLNSIPNSHSFTSEMAVNFILKDSPHVDAPARLQSPPYHLDYSSSADTITAHAADTEMEEVESNLITSLSSLSAGGISGGMESSVSLGASEAAVQEVLDSLEDQAEDDVVEEFKEPGSEQVNGGRESFGFNEEQQSYIKSTIENAVDESLRNLGMFKFVCRC